VDTTHRPVLVVDDDADILDVYSVVLEDAGYEVLTAGNGQEALERVRRPDGSNVSLILLDVMMPVMNGWEFLAQRSEDPKLRNIPVVVCTGDPRAFGHTPEGVAAVLQKPIGLDTLLAAIRRYGA